MKRMKELFTASDVARFCQVDLKTIHNWADRGEIRHFRTPGRHLRFQRSDVLDFLRRFGYPIPPGLVTGAPRLVVIEKETDTRQRIVESLGRIFRVVAFACPFEALIEVGAEPPDAVVIGGLSSELDTSSIVRALSESKSTHGTRAFRLGESSFLNDAPAEAIALPESDFERQARILTDVLGMDR